MSLFGIFGTPKKRRTSNPKNKKYVSLKGLEDQLIPDKYMVINALFSGKKHIPFYVTASSVTRRDPQTKKPNLFAEIKWIKTYSSDKLKNYGNFDIKKYPAYSNQSRLMVEKYLKNHFDISLNQLEKDPEAYASVFNEKYRIGVEKMNMDKAKKERTKKEPIAKPAKAPKTSKVKSRFPINYEPFVPPAIKPSRTKLNSRPTKAPDVKKVPAPAPQIERVIEIESTTPAPNNGGFDMASYLTNLQTSLNNLKNKK